MTLNIPTSNLFEGPMRVLSSHISAFLNEWKQVLSSSPERNKLQLLTARTWYFGLSRETSSQIIPSKGGLPRWRRRISTEDLLQLILQIAPPHADHIKGTVTLCH